MHMLLMMLGAVLSPLLGLFLLLWLAHLEDTLARDVAQARRRPAPAPILAVPVRSARPESVPSTANQRPAPATERAPSRAALGV